MTWEQFKGEKSGVVWGEELFAKIGSYDVLTSSDAEGFAKASTLASAELEEELRILRMAREVVEHRRWP